MNRFLNGRTLPVIVCGDFNSQPHSAVYELLSTGRVSLPHAALENDPDGIFPDKTLYHHFGLQSSYAAVSRNEPPYTNYTGHWVGTVDYIWHTCDVIPIAVAKVHDPEILEAYSNSALPNCQFPSDHVPLITEFIFPTGS